MYDETTNVKKIVGISAISLLLLIFIFGGIVIVPTGQRGIATRFGAVTGVIRDQGIHFKLPIIEGNRNLSVQIEKSQVKIESASKDLQSVTSEVVVNYHLNASQVSNIFQNIGDQYEDKMLSPSISESIKAVTSRYTAEELITKRPIVRDEMKKTLSDKMGNTGIIIDEINIINFDFSESFNKAIENKVTAEQNALAAKNKLEQTKYEADQNIAEAEGKAKALQVEGDALKNNPEVATLRAIEKWNGVLPITMTGSAVPFLNLK